MGWMVRLSWAVFCGHSSNGGSRVCLTNMIPPMFLINKPRCALPRQQLTKAFSRPWKPIGSTTVTFHSEMLNSDKTPVVLRSSGFVPLLRDKCVGPSVGMAFTRLLLGR
jgi:hypothetical protein